MKRILSVLAAAALMAVVAGPSLAQEAAKKAEAPKAAPSTSQAVLEQWNDIGRKLIAIAEDWPENKFDYKPNPDSRTFVAQLLHASAAMYFFTDVAQGKKSSYSDDPSRENLKTKEQVVAFVKKCGIGTAGLCRALFFGREKCCAQNRRELAAINLQSRLPGFPATWRRAFRGPWLAAGRRSRHRRAPGPRWRGDAAEYSATRRGANWLRDARE